MIVNGDISATRKPSRNAAANEASLFFAIGRSGCCRQAPRRFVIPRFARKRPPPIERMTWAVGRFTNGPTPRITRIAYNTSAVFAPRVRKTARAAPSRKPRAKARTLTGPGEAAKAKPRRATEGKSLIPSVLARRPCRGRPPRCRSRSQRQSARSPARSGSVDRRAGRPR